MVYWLVLLWVNPIDHRIEFGNATAVYQTAEECEDVRTRELPVPAIRYTNKKGEQLFPTHVCVAARK